MSSIGKTDRRTKEQSQQLTRAIALQQSFLYYWFAGFLLLLLWNPVLRPMALQQAPSAFFQHVRCATPESGPRLAQLLSLIAKVPLQNEFCNQPDSKSSFPNEGKQSLMLAQFRGNFGNSEMAPNRQGR
jgi:hypothetical protein